MGKNVRDRVFGWRAWLGMALGNFLWDIFTYSFHLYVYSTKKDLLCKNENFKEQHTYKKYTLNSLIL